MKKRGFERISKEQFDKDFQEFEDVKYEDLKEPRRGTALSAGYDIFSPISFSLQPGEDIKLPTGFKAYMLDDEAIFALPRSGQGFKYYLRLANTIGLIDADYFDNKSNEGHIWVKIRNEGSKPITIQKGEAFCQMVFKKYLLADGDSFKGEKRIGGFNSTGKEFNK